MRCFLSVDPGKDWNAKQPQSWNLYAYVRSNPMNAVDPNGKALLDALDMIRTRLQKAMTHFDRANEALAKVPVTNISAGGKLYGGTFQAGPIKAEARVDLRVGRIGENGAVPVTLRGAIQGGANGTKYQAAVRLGVSGEVGSNEKLMTAGNFRVVPDATIGTESSAGRSSPGQISVTGGIFGIVGEVGIDYDQAARGLGELGEAFTAIIVAGTPVKDPEQ